MAGELVHATVGTNLTQAEYESTSAHTMTWQDWTPTVTQSAAITVTIGEAKYCVIGKLVILYANLTCTTSGTAGNDIVIGGLPTAAAMSGDFGVGSGLITDSGSATYGGCSVILASTTTFKFRGYNVTGYMGTNPSFQITNNDTIGFSAMYRIA